MNFIHLTWDKLIKLVSSYSVINGSDETFAGDFDVMQTIPCLEQPALKHVVLCVEYTDFYGITKCHNVRMTKDIWDSGILITKSHDVPAEYTDGKAIGQHWLAITHYYWDKDRKVKLPTVHVRPSISAPGYIDILLPQEGAKSLYNKLTNHDSSENAAYTIVCSFFVNYIVVNQVLLSNGGKYHKTGSNVSKSSVLSMAKRTLPGKVSLKNIDIDVDAFIADHPPRKHDETSNDAVKIWHCPAWEVRGHYRHYKSGKVIYVKPHVKGKLRDTLVVGREYDLDVKCKEK